MVLSQKNKNNKKIVNGFPLLEQEERYSEIEDQAVKFHAWESERNEIKLPSSHCNVFVLV